MPGRTGERVKAWARARKKNEREAPLVGPFTQLDEGEGGATDLDCLECLGVLLDFETQ
jgi:hypothetical protein